MKVFKDDIIREYSQRQGINGSEAKRRFDDIIDIITENLIAGNDIKIPNFFNFFVKELKAKPGINPITKDPIIIQATKTIQVKMTKPLKDQLKANNLPKYLYE